VQPAPAVTGGNLLRLEDGQLRVSPWRGSDGVTLVNLVPGAATPGAAAVRRFVDDLARRGVRRVLTGALSPSEQRSFLSVGFQPHEHLHLLSHDLRRMPERSPRIGLRRGRRADRPAVLAVDHLAFDAFWRLDERGLESAMRATVTSRHRVVVRGGVVGYAITGRSGSRGYLQRLAVHPDHQREGHGGTLVLDGLRWLRRHGTDQAVVNTQVGNVGALALYQHLGFELLPEGLVVLALDLASAS
jgi:ribosomal protein S18 acetylase RimI-like enzyme